MIFLDPAHCVSPDPVMREIWRKTHCPDCVTCNRGIECSKFQPPQKTFFVDKAIGAIWPNSSVQSQMKLFAEKINPPSLYPSLPPSLPCICEVSAGFWV